MQRCSRFNKEVYELGATAEHAASDGPAMKGDCRRRLIGRVEGIGVLAHIKIDEQTSKNKRSMNMMMICCYFYWHLVGGLTETATKGIQNSITTMTIVSDNGTATLM